MCSFAVSCFSSLLLFNCEPVLPFLFPLISTCCDYSWTFVAKPMSFFVAVCSTFHHLYFPSILGSGPNTHKHGFFIGIHKQSSELYKRLCPSVCWSVGVLDACVGWGEGWMGVGRPCPVPTRVFCLTLSLFFTTTQAHRTYSWFVSIEQLFGKV